MEIDKIRQAFDKNGVCIFMKMWKTYRHYYGGGYNGE